MRNRLIEIFKENQQQIYDEMAIGVSMYGVMADQIIKELEAGQHETVVIGNLKGKVLTYNGQFVNEYMLHRGIYTTKKPTIHWDEELNIEKYISDHWFVRETMEVEYPKETYENIRKCEFVSVTLKVDQ